ncbi:MAG: helix-turn-helix domain-containing protein, partial [Cytophagales bacterium]
MQHELISQIGKRIKAIRNEQRITLQELSSRSELSKGLLSKIENSRTIPSLPVFLSIMKAIETNPKDFFDSLSMPGFD